MTEKSLIQNYLRQKVNPHFEQLLTQIIKSKPKNVLNYCKSWIQKKCQQQHEMIDQSESDQQAQQHDTSQLLLRKGQNRWYQRRKGICGQVYGSHCLWHQPQLPLVNKTSITNNRILFKLKSLFVFKEFNDEDIHKIILAMTEHSYQPKSYIIKEGQTSHYMFIVDSGELQCIKDTFGQHYVCQVFKQGQMFGQDALLYNAIRGVSVKAKTRCLLFRLERKMYYSIAKDRNLKKRKIFNNAIQKCQFLRQLQTQQKYKLQDLIEEIPVHQNQYIINSGKTNKKMYIIQSGKFVSLKKQKNGHDQIISQLKQGDIFGQSCLISKKASKESVMSLTVGKLYGLQFASMQRILGPIRSIIDRSLNYNEIYKL